MFFSVLIKEFRKLSIIFATAMEKVGLTVPVYLGNKQIAEATTQMVVKELNRDNSNNFR